MGPIDGNVLTDTLNHLIDLCGRNSVVFDSGYTLLMKFMIPIDFCFAILMNMMSFGGNGYIPLMFSKIMRYGFWVWFFRNWDMIVNAVIKSLTRAGAGFGSLDAQVVERPSEILNYGFVYAGQFMDTLNKTKFDSLGNIGRGMIIWIISLIAFVGIFVAFAYIALNAFITVMEFKIVSALLLLFVPFAVNDRTSRYAENALGFILGTGVKMMLMAAIISLSINASKVLNDRIDIDFAKNGGIVGWQDAFSAVILAWIFAFLAVQVPAMAAGAMSGSPSLSGGMATSSAMGAIAAGGAIAGGGGSLARGASFAAGAFAQGATSGAAGATAGKVASALGGGGLASTIGSTVGALKGGGQALGKAMGNYATKGMQDSFDMGNAASTRAFGQYHSYSGGLGNDSVKTSSGSGNTGGKSKGSGGSGKASGYQF